MGSHAHRAAEVADIFRRCRGGKFRDDSGLLSGVSGGKFRDDSGLLSGVSGGKFRDDSGVSIPRDLLPPAAGGGEFGLAGDFAIHFGAGREAGNAHAGAS